MKPVFIIAAMSPEFFPAVAAFARVAHHASFTRAAAETGVSTSALSQTVRSLESHLGVRLLNRTTRRVGLTEAGQRFLRDALPGLATLTAAFDAVDESRDKPAGLLRLNVSRSAAEVLLVPHLADFMAAYADITLEMHCDNALVDLVGGGFDAGLRIGENLAQDVVAVPLGGRNRLATVAAPRYLQGRTAPTSPQELADHRCLDVRLTGGLYRWEYSRPARRNAPGGDFDIEPSGVFVTNDGDLNLSAARAGAGITCVFEALAQHDFDTGRLVPLLKPWWPEFPGFYLYYPSRAHMARKLRVFIDFMQARLGNA